MGDLGDFVRKTLALLFNLVVAIATLATTALLLRPVRGAIRCKVRCGRDADAPEGRLVLFLACFFCAVVCDSWPRGIDGVAFTLGRIAVGADSARGPTILVAVLFYLACELAIAKMFPTKRVPGRKGLRNRELSRFLVASLMVQFAIYEPLAFIATGWLTAAIEALAAAVPGALTDFVDVVRLTLVISLLLAPLLVLSRVFERTPSLRMGAEGAQAIGRLPINLMGAALLAEVISQIVFAPATPQIASMECVTSPAGESTNVSVDAQLVNQSDRYWRPAAPVKLALLDKLAPVSPETRDKRLTIISSSWSATTPAAGPDVILVPPHAAVHLVGRVAFNETVVDPSGLSCALINGRRPLGLLAIFRSEVPQEDLLWAEVKPSSSMEGSLVATPVRPNK